MVPIEVGVGPYIRLYGGLKLPKLRIKTLAPRVVLLHRSMLVVRPTPSSFPEYPFFYFCSSHLGSTGGNSINPSGQGTKNRGGANMGIPSPLKVQEPVSRGAAGRILGKYIKKLKRRRRRLFRNFRAIFLKSVPGKYLVNLRPCPGP